MLIKIKMKEFLLLSLKVGNRCPERKVGLHIYTVLFSSIGWLRKRNQKGQEGPWFGNHLDFLECSCFLLLWKQHMVPADSMTSMTVESLLAIRQPIYLVFLFRLVELRAFVIGQILCTRDIKDVGK